MKVLFERRAWGFGVPPNPSAGEGDPCSTAVYCLAFVHVVVVPFQDSRHSEKFLTYIARDFKQGQSHTAARSVKNCLKERRQDTEKQDNRKVCGRTPVQILIYLAGKYKAI